MPLIISHCVSVLCVWILSGLLSVVCVFSNGLNSVRSGLGTGILGTLQLPGEKKVPWIMFSFLFKIIASK